MQPVRVLVGVDGVEHRRFVDVRRERKLNEVRVDGGIVVVIANDVE